MERIGLDAALRDAGIQNGETVFIGDYELEWEE
jgi:GTP-binding protein